MKYYIDYSSKQPRRQLYIRYPYIDGGWYGTPQVEERLECHLFLLRILLHQLDTERTYSLYSNITTGSFKIHAIN